MPSLKCTNSRCTWVTDDVSEAMAFNLVKLHLQSEHKMELETKSGAKGKADKLRRPEVAPEMSNDRWAYFETRWEAYKVGCGLKDDNVVGQLMECMVDAVREDHYRQFGGTKAETEKELLEQIKQVAVPKSSRAVQRDSLTNIKQERGEGVRKFCGRIRAVALVCEFETECVCGKTTSYMDLQIKDKVVSGIYDGEIKTDILSHQDINKWGLEDLLSYVESKEAGKKSATVMGGSGSVSGVFKKREERRKTSSENKGQPGGCENCGRTHGKNGECWAKEKTCYNCDKTGHLSAKCRQPRKAKGKMVKQVDTEEKKDTVESVQQEDDHWIAGVDVSDKIFANKPFTVYTGDSFVKDAKETSETVAQARESFVKDAKKSSKTARKSRGYSIESGMVVNTLFGAIVAGASVLGTGDMRLGHNVFNGNTWVSKSARGKPMITLRSRIDLSSYDDLGVRRPRVLGDQVKSGFMADTGASVSIAGMNYARELGIREDDLLKSNLAVSSADGSKIGVLGSVLVELENSEYKTKEQVYICRGTRGCLLSL